MNRIRTFRVTPHSRQKAIRIEAPGCVVTVRMDLQDSAGHPITTLSLDAHGTRYAGEAPWWIEGRKGSDSLFVRVCQMEED